MTDSVALGTKEKKCTFIYKLVHILKCGFFEIEIEITKHETPMALSLQYRQTHTCGPTTNDPKKYA